MTTMVDLHAKTDPDNFAPAVTVLIPGSPDPTFSLTLDKFRHFGAFLSHDQMVEFRDVLAEAIIQSPVRCSGTQCDEQGKYYCENSDCSKRFCADHGQKGGDQEVADFGMVAVPSICDACIDRSRR